MRPTRGEIYWVEFDPVKGSEQGGLRPAVVVQNDVGNRFSPTTVVAAITRNMPPKAYPFVVILEAEEGGFSHRSVVNCSQLATIQIAGTGSRLRPPPGKTGVRAVGKLGRKSLDRIGEALRYNLAI